MAAASPVFRAVADPTRRGILDLLHSGELSVSDLLAHFSCSQPALSKHLAVLREAGLVRQRKDGRRRLYSLRAARLRCVYDWSAHYQKFWQQKLDQLGDVLEDDA